MPKKYHKPEEIVLKLRQVDVLTSQGRPAYVAADRICTVEGLMVPPAIAEFFFEDDGLHSRLKPGKSAAMPAAPRF